MVDNRQCIRRPETVNLVRVKSVIIYRWNAHGQWSSVQYITCSTRNTSGKINSIIMRAFIIFSCLALATAKPQYSYSQPNSLLGSSSISHGSAHAGPALLAPSSSSQNLGFAAPAPGNATHRAYHRYLVDCQGKLIDIFFIVSSLCSVAYQSYQPAPITTTTVQKHIYVSFIEHLSHITTLHASTHSRMVYD